MQQLLKFCAQRAATATLAFVCVVAASGAHGAAVDETFARLKSLAGTWEVTAPSGASYQASYEVEADGSMVLEKLMGMVTTYYVDAGELQAVHYCSAHNQPHYRVNSGASASGIQFEADSVGGLASPDDGYMAKLSFKFMSADAFTQAWTWREKLVDQAPEVFSYKRLLAPGK